MEKTATSKVLSHDGQICVSSADKFEVSGNCLDGDAASISMKNGPKENDNLFAGQDSSASDNNGTFPMKLDDCSSCDLKENTITDEKNISSASIPMKSSKAGRPPSSEEVQMWKKNGFTRYYSCIINVYFYSVIIYWMQSKMQYYYDFYGFDVFL